MNFIFSILSDYSYSLLSALIGIFPSADSGMISNIHNNTVIFRDMFQSFEYIFPATLFFTVLAFVITVESLMFLFKASRWILSIISVGVVK